MTSFINCLELDLNTMCNYRQSCTHFADCVYFYLNSVIALKCKNVYVTIYRLVILIFFIDIYLKLLTVSISVILVSILCTLEVNWVEIIRFPYILSHLISTDLFAKWDDWYRVPNMKAPRFYIAPLSDELISGRTGSCTHIDKVVYKTPYSDIYTK